MDFETTTESLEGSEEQSKEKLNHLRKCQNHYEQPDARTLDVKSATSESSEGNEEQVDCTLSTKQNLLVRSITCIICLSYYCTVGANNLFSNFLGPQM